MESASALRKLPRLLRPGVWLYRFYHTPKGFLHKTLKEGPVNRLITYRGRVEMEKAADRLPPISNGTGGAPLEVHFLTGRRFWYQTCFCMHSMIQHSDIGLRPVISDDGTLGQKYADKIRRVFPDARIIFAGEAEARLDDHLPRHKFPTLRQRRLSLPLMRKLMDIHGGSSGWKLFLDSDMLFFKRPAFLLEWLQTPTRPCHMVDVGEAYGYSARLMTSLTQAAIPERLNSGICGLKSDELDWERLEFWCKTMLEREGSSYYQEQALTAMLMAGKSCAVVPAADYVVLPAREEVIGPKAVLHHYVAESKSWYFRYGWKHVLRGGREPNPLSAAGTL